MVSIGAPSSIPSNLNNRGGPRRTGSGGIRSIACSAPWEPRSRSHRPDNRVAARLGHLSFERGERETSLASAHRAVAPLATPFSRRATRSRGPAQRTSQRSQTSTPYISSPRRGRRRPRTHECTSRDEGTDRHRDAIHTTPRQLQAADLCANLCPA